MQLAVLFGSAFLSALLLTPAAGAWARRFGPVDQPGGPLKIHEQPIPRSGGLAILVALLVSQGLAAIWNHAPFTWAELATLVLLFALGTWDDFRPRSARLRLLIQILIHAASWFLGVQMEVFGALIADYLISLVCFIVVVNAVNFYDGMDGVAALTAIAALGVWSAVAVDAGMPFMPFAVTAAAVLGFLPRNWPPGKIFLGDGGSFIIGFVFYMVFVRLTPESAGIIPGFWVAAVPVCDAVAATLDRLFSGGDIWSGDRFHIYDILYRRGYTPARVALILALMAALLSRMAGALLGSPWSIMVTVTIALYLVFVAFVWMLRRHFRQRPA